MKVIRPFGPTIAKASMSESLVNELNDYVDKTLKDKPKTQELDYGKMLAGNVQQEFLLDKEFTFSSGWEFFLKENTEKWIFESTNEKVTEFKIIDTWIVRQFENEYNPLHSHGGHISGVGYLKLPDNYGETVQKSKEENFNGNLQLVHGSKNFLSPITLNIKPKVGDFYFFPHYLMHSVYPFKNKNAERRSVSFNAYIDADIYNSYGKKIKQ
tara:strand:+ start:503 stop:1138 length:636 start_codon:yes stop_codon:yes gene_type:complete